MKKYIPLLSLLLFLVSCSNNENSGVTPKDNDLPLFEDVNGEMEMLYCTNAYTYSEDLVDQANKGNEQAMYLLANMYAYGIGGVEANRVKAFHYYRALANKGDADAQAITGYMLIYGLGPIEDLDAGLEMLVESANQRNAFAFLILGKYYMAGLDDPENGPDNRKLARFYLRVATELGIEAAQDLLAQVEQ